jgi:hypothetical protein
MNRWREVYGSSILVNLAYCYALKRNIVMAKEHLEEYKRLYGDYSNDPDENFKL